MQLGFFFSSSSSEAKGSAVENPNTVNDGVLCPVFFHFLFTMDNFGLCFFGVLIAIQFTHYLFCGPMWQC